MKESTYKITIVYNDLFIDQGSRRKGDERNREFWQAMDGLHSRYPGCNILVERYAKEHFSTGIGEDVRIICSSPDVQKMADHIYDIHYYVVPISLSVLGDGEKEDAIAHVLRNDVMTP